MSSVCNHPVYTPKLVFVCITCRTGVRRALEVLHMFCGIMEQRICIVSALKEW